MACLNGFRDSLGEPHRVAQALEEVLHLMDRLAAGTVELLAVDGAVDAVFQWPRSDSGDLVGEFTQDRLDLLGMAGALGEQLAAQLALGLGAGQDGVDLIRGPPITVCVGAAYTQISRSG